MSRLDNINPDAKNAAIGCMIMVGLTLASVFLIQLFAIGDNQPPYNENVFDAFRAIEAQCMSQEIENLTVRCDAVIKRMQSCHENENGCAADGYYDFLDRLMFDLPPLREGVTR